MKSPITRCLVVVPAVVVGIAACGGEAADGFEVDDVQAPVVYGNDGRVEYGTTSGRLRTWANATALLTYPSDLACANGSCTLATAPLNLCAGEKFAGQPQAKNGDCTAFLVGPDRFVTAGHCISAAGCANRRVVFGYSVTGGAVNTTIPTSDVYSCTEVVADATNPDYAVFRVDRPVTGRTPLWIRYTGTVANAQALTLIGYPSTLPLKIDQGGSVKVNNAASSFDANIDAFGGNSGSPVINTSSGVVEGVLVSGNTDYVQNGACMVVNTCTDAAGCPGYETVTRATELHSYVPLHPAGIYVSTAL